jgi:hypothetical protein
MPMKSTDPAWITVNGFVSRIASLSFYRVELGFELLGGLPNRANNSFLYFL